MKVLMTLAGAGYGMQEQNIPNAERKKKKIHYVPVKEQALLIIYLCLVTQPKELNEGVISFVL